MPRPVCISTPSARRHSGRALGGSSPHDGMSTAIKKAIVPAAVMALVAAPIFGTQEAITMVILSVAGFVAAMVALVAFWRLTPAASWARWQQRLATWLIAAGGAAAGCCLMLAPFIFRR